MKIRVKDIKPEISKNGKSYYSVFDIGGQRFSLWDTEIRDKLSIGHSYDFEVETREWNGNDYFTIKSLIGASQEPKNAPRTRVEPKNDISAPLTQEREISIYRQVALKAAAQAGLDTQETIERAEAYLEYLKSGEVTSDKDDSVGDDIPF